MKLASYEKYKETELVWFGEIPKHWEVGRLKDIAEVIAGQSPNETSYNQEGDGAILINGPAEYSKEDFGYTRAIKWTTEPTKIIGENILLLCLRGSTTGRLNISHTKVCIGRGVAGIRAFENQCFLNYLFMLLRPHIIGTSKGTTFASITSEDLKNTFVLKPSSSEQIAIANYLDTKTTQIDRKIRLLEQKISAYHELRTVLINETVCRGLHKDVPLKDSGVPWIGKLPAHWRLERLKNIFNERVEKNLRENGDPVTSNILSVMKDIGVINHSEKGNVGNKMASDITAYKLVYPNDIVVNKMNIMIGSVGIAKEFGALSVIYIVLSAKKGFSPHYYDYLFQIKGFQRYLRTIATGILEIREAVNSTLFAQQEFPVPPIHAQKAMVRYLDEKTQKIDAIITNLTQQVEKLQELKTTLINAVVTGKLKVS